jgi:hypothetical protein
MRGLEEAEAGCGGGSRVFEQLERSMTSSAALSSLVAPLFAAGLLNLPRSARSAAVASLPMPLSAVVREQFKALRSSGARLEAARAVAPAIPLADVLSHRPSSVQAASAMLLAAVWGMWRSMTLSRLAPSGEWLAQRWNTDPQQAAALASWWEAELRSAA